MSFCEETLSLFSRIHPWGHISLLLWTVYMFKELSGVYLLLQIVILNIICKDSTETYVSKLRSAGCNHKLRKMIFFTNPYMDMYFLCVSKKHFLLIFSFYLSVKIDLSRQTSYGAFHLGIYCLPLTVKQSHDTRTFKRTMTQRQLSKPWHEDSLADHDTRTVKQTTTRRKLSKKRHEDS